MFTKGECKWPLCRTCKRAGTLIQGLEQLERVAGVVVVSRPAKMRTPAVAESKPTKK